MKTADDRVPHILNTAEDFFEDLEDVICSVGEKHAIWYLVPSNRGHAKQPHFAMVEFIFSYDGEPTYQLNVRAAAGLGLFDIGRLSAFLQTADRVARLCEKRGISRN